MKKGLWIPMVIAYILFATCYAIRPTMAGKYSQVIFYPAIGYFIGYIIGDKHKK